MVATRHSGCSAGGLAPAAGGFLDTKEHPSKALCSSCGVRAADRVQYPREPRTTSHRGRVVNESKPPPQCHARIGTSSSGGHRVPAGGDFFARSADPGPPGVVSRDCLRFESGRQANRAPSRARCGHRPGGRRRARGGDRVRLPAQASACRSFDADDEVLGVYAQEGERSAGPKGGGLAGLSKSMDGCPTAGRARVEDREARP